MKRNSKEVSDHARTSQNTPKIIAMSFFSGAMGFDIGMKNVGLEAVLACENNKACRMTIAKNNPDIGLIGDIWEYSVADLYRMAGLPQGHKVDIIFGGPPCQAFSTAGHQKGFDDPRGNAFLKYIAIVGEVRPTYVVIENVRGLLTAEAEIEGKVVKGGALRHILKQLQELGYSISFNLYNAANYGAPQVRERVVIIGHLGPCKVPYITPTNSEVESFGLPKWKTLRDAFDCLPEGVEHHYIKFPESRLQFYRLLKEGQNWKNLPVDMQKKALGKAFYTAGGKTGFYRRLSFDKPSTTLLTSPAMLSTALTHPIENRPLSVEEYSVIQGFPLDWEFCGSLADIYRQIGNAVPIKLGEAIGRTILAHMRGYTSSNELFDSFPYSRYKNTDEVSWEKQLR